MLIDYKLLTNLIFFWKILPHFAQLYEDKGYFQSYNPQLQSLKKLTLLFYLLFVYSYSKFISRFVPVGIIGAFWSWGGCPIQEGLVNIMFIYNGIGEIYIFLIL